MLPKNTPHVDDELVGSAMYLAQLYVDHGITKEDIAEIVVSRTETEMLENGVNIRARAAYDLCYTVMRQSVIRKSVEFVDLMLEFREELMVTGD